jgi:methyl-accepting chemotaxis protein
MKKGISLKWALGLVLITFITIPLIVSSLFIYDKSRDRLYEDTKAGLEERMDFCLTLCESYYKKVIEGELTKEQAISEIATLLAGPLMPDGKRDISKGFGKGKEGYIDAINSNGDIVFHPYWEGIKNIYNISDPTVKEAYKVQAETKTRLWYEYMWLNPGEDKYYKKAQWLDYFEPFDLHFSVNVTMDEFIAPAKKIANIVIIATIIALLIGILASLLISSAIAKPFSDLSEVSSRIIKGDLTARVDTKTPIKEFSIVSKDINQMVDNLANMIDSIKESEAALTNTLNVCGENLDMICERGNLSARINSNRLTGNYKKIGDNINKIVDNLQDKIDELRKRDEQTASAILALKQVLDKVATGDLSVRVDTKGWGKELEVVGKAINDIISSLEVIARKI